MANPPTTGSLRPRLPLTFAGMPRRTLTWMLAVSLLACLLAATTAPSAGAALPFAPCSSIAGFSCASLPVPLDRSGKAPGTIVLPIERKSAGTIQTQSAVIALAGGTGQAANPLGEQRAAAIARALHSPDLLVFDQRGTGRASPLKCPIFNDEAALEKATES